MGGKYAYSVCINQHQESRSEMKKEKKVIFFLFNVMYAAHRREKYKAYAEA